MMDHIIHKYVTLVIMMDHIIPKYVTLVIMMDHMIPKYVNNPGTPFCIKKRLLRQDQTVEKKHL